MTDASSSTTPSSFGVPPNPTEWSLGSASTIATPAIAASSGSAPFLIISIAISTVLRLLLAITMGRLGPVGLGSAAPMANVLKLRPVNAVEPMKCRRFKLDCIGVCFSLRSDDALSCTSD